MKDFLAFDVCPREWPTPRLIDVTLRDGGFRNNFRWSIDDMITIATAATAAGVHCVELGYVGGVPELHGVDDAGPTASLTPQDVAQVRERVGEKLLCAMVHPSAAITMQPFEELRRAGLNMIRFVYHENWEKHFVLLAEAAASAGLSTSANIALASRYDLTGIVERARRIESSVDLVYLADTCAAMLPTEVDTVTRALVKLHPVGFHAHDFLSMALANALSATSAGATWIDASISGIGRGAGNLRLELWLALQAASTGAGATLRPLLPAMRMIEGRIGPHTIPDLGSIVSGALNLTPPQEDQLRSFAKAEKWSIDDAAAALLDNQSLAASVPGVFKSIAEQRM
ncbi:hypothetical protein [Bradyrhizobium sp. SZCCHNR3015]|uniref:hypothetical protein n=1 Tax=Bradyrhizobium sp. SZCCHNR3015 TaxID=3057395 RepID=UPI0029163865|nr:hypothetical protein [Bradyrhizobium sp. SZCCHNR3015]